MILGTGIRNRRRHNKVLHNPCQPNARTPPLREAKCLPIGLGHALQLVFFLQVRSVAAGIQRREERSGQKRTLMAYELDEPFAALMSSSARHSAIDFTLRNADSRV
jgi:hypothetical protein